MHKTISIHKDTVHLWRVDLNMIAEDQIKLLSADEAERAHRFKFDIHRQRYIAARASLRRILSFYTDTPPEDIHFDYGKRGKPFLKGSSLQFNVSHSDHMAVFALTMDHEIGVDIEKIEPEFKDSVASRFFSQQEYKELQQLSDSEKVPAFYRIWSKKEALIKALGEGLFAPLDAFSVSVNDGIESVKLIHENITMDYHLQTFFAYEGYQAAFATTRVIKSIEDWCLPPVAQV
jgi:4'-phosphopantetheinyl transferase